MKRKRTVSRAGYAAYMKSAEWQATRRRWMASGIAKLCAGCDKPWGAGDHLHHVSYRRLGCEHMGDLVPLCNSCHGVVHKAIGPDWRRLYAVTFNAIRAIRAGRGLPNRGWSEPARPGSWNVGGEVQASPLKPGLRAACSM